MLIANMVDSCKMQESRSVDLTSKNKLIMQRVQLLDLLMQRVYIILVVDSGKMQESRSLGLTSKN